MIKYYYFISNRYIERNTFDKIIRNSYSYYIDIDYFDNFSGVIVSDEFFYNRLKNIEDIISFDLASKFIFLASFKDGSFNTKIISKMLEDDFFGVYDISKIVLKYALRKDYSIYQLIIDEFKNVKRDVFLTAYTYIEVGKSATLASKQLFIHRNTFNYRLNKFIDITGLDIRDNYNSFLFMILKEIGETIN